MTTREDFEKWAKDDKRLAKKVEWLEDYQLYEHLITQSAYESWQACAAHYEAEQAKDYAEWIDERNALLALIAEKDKALREIGDIADNSAYPNAACVKIAEEALSLTHDSVSLVEVDPVDYDAMSLISDGTKLYTIVKGE